jgi:indole-3-glycerol phosphate synthase
MAAGVPRGETYLSGIVDSHRRDAARDRRDVDRLVRRARGEAGAIPATRGFIEVIRGARAEGGTAAVIAEIKRRSPSRGDLLADLDPASVAQSYEAGGAGCLSVLTDERYFGGSAADLTAARRACGLPVLRKDFTVSEADVADARIMGADAILLIVSALSDAELFRFAALARELSLDALVEVHDEEELERALCCGADLIGVNQRDLSTFEVDPQRALRLASRIPESVAAVAESGVKGADDVARLASAGYEAVLVGESVVTSGDPESAVRALTGHPVGVRAVRAGTAGG